MHAPPPFAAASSRPPPVAPGALAQLHPTAFITGASAGLGLAFTSLLLAEGVRVWGTARDPARLAEAARLPGFTPVSLDLAHPAEAEAAFTRAESEAGGFSLVINNAGYGVFAAIEQSDPAVWERQAEAMLFTTLRLGRLAVRGFQARGAGCLVNVSSLAVEFPLPYMSGYNVAKAGLSAWSESAAYELPGRAVRVIDFRPGDFNTRFNQVAERGPGADTPRAERVWQRLGRNLAAAPGPERAAADLHRALLARRRGVVRTGSFFQARLAPLLARFGPWRVRHAVQRRYFDLD